MGHEIEVQNLTKEFPQPKTYRQLLTRPFARQDITAIKNVTFSVSRGEIFGLLGPNGAGKTTITKILSALIFPTSGTVCIKGCNVIAHEKEIRRIVGCVIGEERSFYWRLTGRQNLRFFATLNNFEPPRAEQRIREIIELVGLNKDIDKVFQHYSSGMKQKLAIARALLADPEVLILDEPTRNLDHISKIQIRRFIKELVKGNNDKTVVMATNDLEEAEDLCDRVAIINQGVVRFCDSVINVKSGRQNSLTYMLRLKGPVDVIKTEFESKGFPAKIRDFLPVDTDGNQTSVRIQLSTEAGDISSVIEWLVIHRLKLIACFPEESDLSGRFTEILQ